MQSRFSFIGTLSFPRETSKRPFYHSFEKNGRKMRSMNFGVKNGNNIGFVELFGYEQNPIRTIDNDNNPMEIDWDDRFDEDIVASVKGIRKFVVDLGGGIGGRKEFLTQYDMIEYLKDHLREYDGRVKVDGQLDRECYQGVWRDRYKVNTVTIPREEAKSKLGITTEIYYNKDSLDKSDYKTEKRVYLNGYIPSYINKDEGIKYVPMQFVLDASKVDMNNENLVKRLKYRINYIDIKAKTMQKLLWDCVLLNGAEEIPFDESQLTPAQKEQVELGIHTVDDFRPRGQIFGGLISEYRLIDPKLTGDYADGLVDTGITVSEFEEDIYQPPKEESLEDMMNEPKEEKDSKEESAPFEEEIDDLDLFS